MLGDRHFGIDDCQHGADFKEQKKVVHGAMKTWAKQASEQDLERRTLRWLTTQLLQMGIELDPGKRNYVGLRFKTQAEIAEENF